MPFRLVTAAMRIFSSNRNYIRELKEQGVVANVLKYGALITVVLWLALALLAKNEDKNRLNESLNRFWSEVSDSVPDTSPEEQKQD